MVLALHERGIANGMAMADVADADESLADLTLRDLVSTIIHSVGEFAEANEHVLIVDDIVSAHARVETKRKRGSVLVL